MKKVIALVVSLFLTCQTFYTVAEESTLSNFSIEGIRIGDRADDHFTGRELMNAGRGGFEHLPQGTFYVHGFPKKEPVNDYDYSFEEYDYVYVITRMNDESLFYMAAVTGMIYFDDINDCYLKKDSIVEQMQSVFKSAKVQGPIVNTNESDPSGKSTYDRHMFSLEEGFARITCHDMDESTHIRDALIVELVSSDANKWLEGKY